MSRSQALIATVMQLVMILSLVSGTNAFFRHLCHGEVGIGRIDPIVSPDKVSQHVHGIHGAQSMALGVSAADLLASNCTSCSVRQDKSAYWAPYLYFLHENGTYQMVPKSGGMTVYYFTEKPADQPDAKIVAFPPGFRMMAGNTFKRAKWESVQEQQQPPNRKTWTDFDKEQQKRAGQMIGFNCLHYAVGFNEDSLGRHEMPDKDFLDSACTDGLRAELMFPTCWNGQNDSANHQDHVAYPTSARNGPCPPGFDQRLPALFFETIFNTPLFQDLKGQFVFANGDPTGFGYHGDFFSAWEGTTLQDAIDNPACTNGLSNGEQSDCPVLDIKSDDEVLNCKMETPEPLQGEQLDYLDTLPGKVAIASGPDWAPMPSHSPPPVPDTRPSESAPTVASSNRASSFTSSGLVGSGTAIASAPDVASGIGAQPSTSVSPSDGAPVSTSSAGYTPLSPTAPIYSNSSSTSDVPSEPTTANHSMSTPADNVVTVTSISTDASGAIVQWVVLQDVETTTVYVDAAGRPTQPPVSTPTPAQHPVKRHRHKHVRVHL